MKIKKNHPWLIIIIIIFAVFIGSLVGTEYGIFGVTFFSIFDLIGKLFINALTLIVVPLVCSSIISGVAKIKGEGSFGRIGGKTFSLFIFINLLAILVGFIITLIINKPLQNASHSFLSNSSVLHPSNFPIAAEPAVNFFDIILQIIPSNIVYAFSKGQMLGLIFFSILFGYVISKIKKNKEVLSDFFNGIFEAMIEMTHIIMNFLPIGVFCLVAKQIAQTGIETLKSLAFFTVIVLLAFSIYCFVVIPILLKFLGKASFKSHIKAVFPALLTGFSTSSSSASLPITIDCIEKRAGVSNRISSLVLPLGTTLNMAASALYAYITAFFIIQIYDIQITLATHLFLVIITLISSMGIAGVPSASLITVIVILKTLGFPVEWVGLFFAVDRIIDMFRTTGNILTITTSAVIIAKSEGEENILTKKTF
jgi:Na+/H+-dicarboxylate symporter